MKIIISNSWLTIEITFETNRFSFFSFWVFIMKLIGRLSYFWIIQKRTTVFLEVIEDIEYLI